MKIEGLPMTDVWAHRVLRERGVETIEVGQQPADIDVLVESADLDHHGPEQNFRPYLHVTGELRAVRPAMSLPYGIQEVAFPASTGERVDGYYEFDEQQLEVLTQKGYFNPGFAVPGSMLGIVWELPAQANALVLPPSGEHDDARLDPPVVFLNVANLGDLSLDLDSTGYDLAEYFADHSAQAASEAVVEVENTRQHPQRTNDLYDLARVTAQVQHGDHETQGAETVPSAQQDQGLEAKLLALGEDLQRREEQRRRELEAEEGTPENLYRDRVAAALVRDRPVAQDDHPRGRAQHQAAEETTATTTSQAEAGPSGSEASSSLAEAKRQVIRKAMDVRSATAEKETETEQSEAYE